MFVVNCLVVVFVGISAVVVVVVVVVLAMIFPKEFIIMDAFPLPVEGTETRVNAGAGANEFMVTFTETCERIGTFCPCQCVWNLLKFPNWLDTTFGLATSPTVTLHFFNIFQPPYSQSWTVAIIVGTWIFNWIYRTELMIPGCGSYCAF